LSGQQFDDQGNMSDVRNTGDDRTAGPQQRGDLFQNAPGIDEVFQHITEDDVVEGSPKVPWLMNCIRVQKKMLQRNGGFRSKRF
jgi:hypothetical protein